MTTVHNGSFTEPQGANNLARNDLINRWGNVYGSWRFLPGTSAFWTMATFQRSTGTVYDDSQNGKDLGYNGNPTFDTHNQFVGYCDFDGTGDFLSIADHADFDISGTETAVAAAKHGLTLVAFFKPDISQTTLICGKTGTAGSVNDSAYALYQAGTNLTFRVRDSGDAANFDVSVNGVVTPGNWHFAAGRYIPGSSIKVWCNRFTNSNTTSIPAALLTSNGAFQVANALAGVYFDGGICLVHLSMMAHGDVVIAGLYEQAAVLFGLS